MAAPLYLLDTNILGDTCRGVDSVNLRGHVGLLLATQALSPDAVLVPHNTRAFERIEGLQLEDRTP